MKVGQVVTVIKCISNHKFDIGERVRYKGLANHIRKFEHLDGRDWWTMRSSEFQVISELFKAL